MRRLIINISKLSLVAGILYYLIATDRLNMELLMLLWKQPLMLTFFAVIMAAWIIPLAAFRWWLLLQAIGLKAPMFQSFLLTWIGNFFNTTLPGAVSGDVVKGYYIIKSIDSGGKTPAFTTLLIDRFVGLFGLIFMAFGAILAKPDLLLEPGLLQPLAWMIAGLFLGTIVFYTIVVFPFKEGRDPFIILFKLLPGKKILIKVYLAFKRYQNQKRALISTLLISIVIHSTIALMFFQIARLIGIKELDLMTQLFIMPIGLITIAIPIAPGGLGVGHGAFEYLYQLMGVQGGANIFNLFIIIQLSIYLLGGIPFLFYRHEHKISNDVAELTEEME